MSNANPNAGHNNIFSNFIHSMNHTSSNMMSSSNDSSSNAGPVYSANRQQPLLQGTAYKLHKKSGKKQKYFVIFDDAPDKPGTARLEYFDNEKKFRSAMAKSPDNGITNQKRSIILCSCFNINRRVDTPKYKNVIGLYRKDDTFSIIMKDEKEMNDWLKQLLVLQRGKELLDGDQPRPIFEHVWEVNVIRRGLGESFGIIGSYRLCISDTTLSLIRVGPDKTTTGDRRVDHVEFALANMRRCGSTLSVFFMEVGRYTLTGAGEIWMETWDPMVAHSMSETILRTAGNKKTNKTEDLGPIMRNRSQSANEASKPINHRRLTQIGPATVRLNVSESSDLTSESPESSFSSATSTTSTSTVVNMNALKPKNNQTHSVSQTSLQSTGAVSTKQNSPSTEKSSNCHVPQSTYANLTPNSSQKDQQASLQKTSDSHVLSTSSSSTICHQRAFSLPQNSNLNVINNQTAPMAMVGNASVVNGTNAIQPVHQRTRSLPLTEETAIDFSQSPPIFARFSPSSSFGESPTNPKINNNSMESIIEDYHSVDMSNNNGSRLNNGNSSILKQLSKVANTKSHNSASSPSQLRKKRHHHNVMTASLRSSSTRERCDSLTLTRTRTNSDSSSNATIQPQLHSLPHQNGISNYNNNNNSMPPPKKIPSRPLSNVFTQRNSPPNNSSPLSPPSATYSTESDGSSISIDEPDFSHHPSEEHFYPKEYQSSITSKTTIPEENENYHQRWTNNNLSLPLNQNNRKGSPNAAPNALPDYMDMGPYSPYSSSPLEGGANNANVYMPMSPGVDYRNDRMYNSSGAHSRASSLAEDNESYVAMHPSSNNADVILQPTGTDDYMNMRPSISSSRNSTRGGDISSATSSCSITSGTPSTDIRFSEYHLDKVQARFTPCEDDDLDRPPRTYSVGSKLEHKRKIAVDRFLAEHISSRHRAYSVGSKNIKVTRAELTSHSGSHTPSHNSPTAINHHQEINNNNSTKNKKSSSAPLLVNHSGRNAHGSGDHMDDLMEIDYSNRSTESINVRHNNVGSPFKSSPVNIPTKTGEDYMNMSGRNSKPHTPSGSNPSPYVDMRPASVRKISENADNEYMDMNAPPRRTNSLSSSPMKNMSAPRTVPLPPSSSNNSYMEMSPRSYDARKNRMISSATSLSSAKAPSDDYLNMSPVNKSLLEVGLPSQSSAPDGYMEMSWNTKNKKSTVIVDKSNENPSSSSDEYINMDFSNNNDGAGTSDSSSSAKDRSISLPITIQKRHSSSSRSKKSTSGSIEEAPPVYLPLANPMTASISPTQSTNRIRCDSRDSGIVTPSSGSQATIFPFSPGSPKKFEAMEDLSRKILMDGTSGTIKLSEDDIIEEEPRTPVPMGMNSEKHVETLSSDYAVMNLGEPVSKKPNLAATPVQIKPSPPSANTSHFLLNPDSGNNDYINCTPNAPSSSSRIVTPKPISPAAHNSKQEVGDYALMNPLKTSMSPVQTPQSSSETPPQTAAKKSLYLQLSSHEKLNSNSCFKPIVEDDQSNRGSHPPLHRQVSERGLQHINDSGYEMLARPSLSRPNSVNNERIKCTPSFLSNRPSSALSSTSLSSNSTLCEIRSQSSSSQTLRNMMDTSAVPSPMSGTSRPESVSSDIHMASRPPSVTSERELHYASLELPPCSSTNLYSLSSSHQKMDVDQKMDFSTSPSPQQTSSSSSSASSQQSQPAFTYAQIDFAKSESLKAQQQQNQSGSKK